MWGEGGRAGVSAGGARVEMGERGVCRGISLLCISVFLPCFVLHCGGQLTTILLHQLNINIKLSLSVYLYGCWLGDTEQCWCYDRDPEMSQHHHPTPALISRHLPGLCCVGRRTGSLDNQDSCRFMTVILLK